MPPDSPLPPNSPLPDARPPPVMHHAPSLQHPLAGLTILAVEDSRYACEALRLFCQRLGARLRRAETCAAATAHLRLYRPDIVLVDLGLPDGPGTALISRLAQSGAGCPPVLGMSGDDGGEVLSGAAGAKGYLAKPLESLGAFRDTLVELLPDRRWLSGLATSPLPLPPPDLLALRDDLERAAVQLAGGAIDDCYLSGFVTGLARATHDPVLERAARGSKADLAPALHHRLARLARVGPFGHL